MSEKQKRVPNKSHLLVKIFLVYRINIYILYVYVYVKEKS